MMWTNAWQQTAKHMQTSASKDQTTYGKLNPKCSSRVHHVHNHQDPNITEIHETHINRIILQHTSHIQHQFDINLTISNRSSKTSFNYQTSNHDN